MFYCKFLAESKSEKKFENWPTFGKVVNGKHRWSFFDSECMYHNIQTVTLASFYDIAY